MLTLALDAIEEVANIQMSAAQRNAWEIFRMKTYKVIITTNDMQQHVYLITTERLDDAIKEAREDLGENGMWVSGQVVDDDETGD